MLQAAGSRWLYFKNPQEIVVTTDIRDVSQKLDHIAAAVQEKKLYAVGFIAYEAALAFEPALKIQRFTGLPLLWFGLYSEPHEVEIPEAGALGAYELSNWQPSISKSTYRRAFDQIKAYIAEGDTYQVNFTLRLRSSFSGSAWDFFLDLVRAQQAKYCAFIDTDNFSICSASPELFFRLTEDELISLPMKGTAPRGRTLLEDRENIQWLQQSIKNRAENLMIVDMIRNDIGRIAEIGSVQVSSLFDIERYPTVLQMTSQVRARTRAAFPEIMATLFPCASITGAPKVRTMQIIDELERDPRGIYTGCIGYLSPKEEAQFNVAIRTVAIDKMNGKAEMGVGGGIVWDSDGEEEYEECQIKARFLTRSRPVFDLLETLLWSPGEEYFLLEEHLHRLSDSSEYFGFGVNIDQARKKLFDCVEDLTAPSKVRLLVKRDGSLRTEVFPQDAAQVEGSWRVALASDPIDSGDPFLFHKTTHRQMYERARRGQPDCNDVLLWNEHKQLTESTVANVVVRLNGELLTPALKCGLLAGTFRQHLLDEGIIHEAILPLNHLHQAEEIFLINSVRKWIPVVLVSVD